MSRSNHILLTIGVIQWVALSSLWRLFNYDQLYFISQALFILSLSIVLLRQFKSIVTQIIFFLAVNQTIDEITMEATTFRISEYITFAIVLLYIFRNKLLKNKTNG